MKSLSWSVVFVLAFVLGASAREWVVAPDGKSSNAGTPDSPLDLASALKGDRVGAGDTVSLRGGEYGPFFVSNLKGTADKPITVRSYPGEWAILADNRANASNSPVLQINGQWTVYRDFEVTNRNPIRTTSLLPKDWNRPSGLQVQAPHTKIVNLVIHDVGTGIGFWRESVDSELYGNIIYNCGWSAPDRGHGHAIYTQNDTGTKLIKDNIVFGQFGWGIHVYPNPGGVQGFDIEGNVSFDNGRPSSPERNYANILLEGYKNYPLDRIQLKQNYTYSNQPLGAGVCLACLNDQSHGEAAVTDNYFVGGDPAVSVGKWRQITLAGNTVIGGNGLIAVRFPDQIAGRWARNTYLNTSDAGAFTMGGRALASSEWQRSVRAESSHYDQDYPKSTKIIFRVNAYDPGRATIIVYNWEHQGTVAVDASALLKPGTRFELRDAQNYLGEPILSGTSQSGPLVVPVRSSPVVTPVGLSPSAANTSGEFRVFILQTRLGSTGPVMESARLNRAVGVPTSNSNSREFAADLDRFAGSYHSRDGKGLARVVPGKGELSLLVESDSSNPVYRMVPESANRFRLEGAPPGFYTTFALNNGKVESMTIQRGSFPPVLLVPTEPGAAALNKYVGEYAGKSPGDRVRVELNAGVLQAVILMDPNHPIFPLDPTAGNRFTMRGAPPGFYIVFENDGRSVTVVRGSYPSVRLVRVNNAGQ